MNQIRVLELRGLLLGLLSLVLFSSPLLAVDCTPNDITLALQAEVDGFQANHGPGCDRVTGTLTITGQNGITNLDGLAALTSVHWLSIVSTWQLQDTGGLAGLSSVTGTLEIRSNTNFNLDGLSGITNLPGGDLRILYNQQLSNLGGLSNITGVAGSLVLNNNSGLQNLDDLSGLSSVGSEIVIHYNEQLTSISGLAGITGFTASLDLRFIPLLASLDGLSGLTDLSGLRLYSNDSLANVDALAGLTTIGNNYSDVWIRNNASLTNLDGLADLVSIDAGIDVSGNSLLDDCGALATLLDQTDDALSGPGPGAAGIPDVNGYVTLSGNLEGCNSIAEIIDPGLPLELELIPTIGGLETDIGVRSVPNDDKLCGWIPGETVAIWWEKPDAELGAFTVDESGCFEGMVTNDIEHVPGSTAGIHVVEARGDNTSVVEAPFEQVDPQLQVNPPTGPPEREVTLRGCDWGSATEVAVKWQRTDAALGLLAVNGSGCINDTVVLPRAKDGIYGLLAHSNAGDDTGAAYWVQKAGILLTPAEGPAGSSVPLAGCNWFPNEQIDFAFSEDSIIFDTWSTSAGGCISTGGPTEPALLIPANATLGEKTVRATGQSSGQMVSAAFTVVERTLEFDPVEGFPGDAVALSGCGWVGNSTVTIEWGVPDTNNLPIRWLANVESSTGCFGLAGDLVINVPNDTTTGVLVQTAVGNEIGQANGEFTVNHSGWIELPTDFAYAGYSKLVKVHGAIVGEELSFNLGFGLTFDTVGATTSDFDYLLNMALNASVGSHSVWVIGNKGMLAQAPVTILDNSEISVLTAGDIYPGSTVLLEGLNWAAAERIEIRLVKGQETQLLPDEIRVPFSSINFSEGIGLPPDLAAGAYVIRATGSKGREAETFLTVTAAPTPAFSLAASFADPPPNLDGILADGEWDYDKIASFSNGFISARSDDSRLYILLDLLADNSNNGAGADNFWLSFDIWNNQVIDAGLDLNFRLDSNGDMIFEEYTGPNSFNPRNSDDLRSAYGDGYSCFVADGSLTVAFIGSTPVLNCNNHRVWEIAIDLRSIGATPGGVARVGVRVESLVPAFSEDYPNNFHSDFSELGSIALAPSRLDSNPPNGAVTGIGSNGFEIEVTQAIQNADNSLSLVADKNTAARVYPEVAAEAMVRTYLFGRKNGADLPGSPLVALATVPTNIKRDQLSHTPAFLLPASWITDGYKELTAIVESLDGSNVEAYQTQVAFQQRAIPEYWVYPFNSGTGNTPIIPEDADMANQQTALWKVLPTADVLFVRRPWGELGHVLSTVPCQDVNTVGNNDDKLDPAEELTCTTSYTVTEGDVGREGFTMWAMAAAEGGVVKSDREQLQIEFQASPSASLYGQAQAGDGIQSSHDASLSLSMTTDVTSFSSAGDVIQYTYTVKSTGADPVQGPVVVTDSATTIDWDAMKADLNNFREDLLQARALSNDATPIPDHFFGYKVFREPKFSGISNAVQKGGSGYVAVLAANSDTAPDTLIHELDHNLDRSPDRTWGHHVTDPDVDDNDDWGCKAANADPAWPYPGNDGIQETGFDPNLPWRGESAAEGPTVVPASKDDFMSYCSGGDPVNWISPYRWEALFSSFPIPSPALMDTVLANGDVFYLSGQLNDDGSGSLAAVQSMPGEVEIAVVSGDYSIELRDSGGGVLYSMPFTASFTDDEGALRDETDFFFRLPFIENVSEVVLRQNDMLLASISASANAPNLEVTTPAGGENWNGEETIQWTADDLDGDPLEFSIFYSPDDGDNWHPVASQLSGAEYTVEVGNLPGGTGGRIMLVATDGFHTVSAVSAGSFSVPSPVPVVVIESPPQGLVITPGDWVILRGNASLPSGLADGLTFAWSVNGVLTELGSEAHLLLDIGSYVISLAAYDDEGNFGESSVTITVEQNNPPNKPIRPNPGDGVNGVFVKSIPSWISGDIDGDPVTFNVYLEADNPEPATLICEDIPLSSCVPLAGLLPQTKYFWQVVARDDKGNTTTGDVWEFETGQHDPEHVIYFDGFE